ncbi:unnamed protein product [Ascophyllum nodosum]
MEHFRGEETNALAEWMIMAAFLTLLVCSIIIAPYGRYSQSVVLGIRLPLVNAKLAWCLMESPNLWMALWRLWLSDQKSRTSPANVALLGMFVGHYVNRSFVFPLRMRGGKPMPLLTMLTATGYCSINGYLQCSHLLTSTVYPDSWIRDPRFIVGSAMFAMGFIINYQSDGILRRLRGPGETGYKIPRGGMFEYVSGANYFGESLEWCGFAIAGWSLPALAFALYTIANISPRAFQHHKWYLDKFRDEYPSTRRAFIPLVW